MPSALTGKIDVPKVPVLITGLVNVLLVSVWVVSSPTRLVAAAGNTTDTLPPYAECGGACNCVLCELLT